MIKKYILGVLVAMTIPVMAAYAATPALMVSGAGDNDNVRVTVSGGEPNAQVVLFYNPTTAGTVQSTTLGYTNQSGYWEGNVSTNATGMSWNTPVYVQVGGYQSLPAIWSQSGVATGSNGAISFSMSSPSFTVGQNGTVTLSGGNGTYYVSSNSNASGVAPTISGNTLTLYGAQAGQSNIIVCSTGGGCGTITATVTGNSSTSGSPMLSQSSLNVNANSQAAVILSGGVGPYTISVPSGSGISTTLVGNTLYVNGSTAGQTTVQVCSANNGGCTSLPVNVTSSTSSSTGTSGSQQMSFVVPVNMGQPVQLMLSGGNGSYYIQSPASTQAMATVSGNTLTLNGSSTGNGTVTVCSTTGGTCLPIAFSVMPALSGTGGGYFFDTDLSIGMTSQDVMELQSRLAAEGYFQAAPTGYFGSITMAAVQSYQAAHGISATGYVGPITRAMLNQ